MEFKGTKDKWNIQWGGKEISILNSKKIEHQANALLISKAPEMLKMLSLISKTENISNFCYEEIKQLIKEATEL